MELNVIATPLVANITHGITTYGYSDEITLFGDGSYDPDYNSAYIDTELDYMWACSNYAN
eukprot:CAMPEP_0201285802 /NCGR_PEP_ID=MMETSP1317-20130820/113838_1 /ASSEMBLY_ACC=CAM_ASM_000770 /TAXON_ID=187299 /ORGANISM="Undescribed Undescribed, Strain Undescribed" /LENGTH=59 /DNA_ID=CAMNT_0047611769 /DNA_START=3206 /DNA_END=3385 /DNA_ORIENTATION=-